MSELILTRLGFQKLGEFLVYDDPVDHAEYGAAIG
jgi:hypothetical protein